MSVRSALLLSALLLSWSCGGSTPTPEPKPAGDAADTQGDPAASDPDRQLAEMARDCEEVAPKIARRQAERTLYERLGGREGIRAMLVEMVDVHMANPKIKPLFDGVDMERFFQNSTDFLVAGSGGDAEYKGRDITAVHRRLDLNSELFLAAGGDLEIAMGNLNVGPAERQEVMCALVSLRGLVLPGTVEQDEH